MEFQRKIRKALIRAALSSNTSWAIVGGALALAVGMQDPFLLLIGAAVETAAVVFMLNSPRFVKKVLGKMVDQDDAVKKARFETILKASDPETRARYQSILKNAWEIEQLGQESDSAFIATGLTTTLSQLQTLREKSTSLVEKRLLIRQYLSGADLAGLEKECQRQERYVGGLQDAVAKKQFTQSLTLKKQELDTYRSMSVALQRIDGQLEQISSTLSSIKGRVVLLKTSEVTTEGGYDRMGDELKGLIGDVEIMESSVQEAAGELSTDRPSAGKVLQQ